MNSTIEVLAEEWLKTYLKRGEAKTESKGCELPSGDNLRKGDVVHLRAKFVRPAEFAPRTHGVFDIGGLVQFSPFAEIVDVELPPLKIGDRVVTPDGRTGSIIALVGEADDLRAYVDTGELIAMSRHVPDRIRQPRGQCCARYWSVYDLTRF